MKWCISIMGWEKLVFKSVFDFDFGVLMGFFSKFLAFLFVCYGWKDGDWRWFLHRAWMMRANEAEADLWNSLYGIGVCFSYSSSV
jgi:hypothetical protein